MQYRSTPVLEAELPELAREVRYEFDMLRWCALFMLTAGEPMRRHALMHNVHAESLSVHVRNLADFFYDPLPPTRGPRCDDVVARHFIIDWDPVADGGEELEFLRSMTLGLNKRLAHVTAYRRRVPKDLDARLVADIFENAAALMRRFLDRLEIERRGWFDFNGPVDTSRDFIRWTREGQTVGTTGPYESVVAPSHQ